MATPPADELARVEELIKKHSIRTFVIGAVDIDGLWRGKRVPAEYFLQGVCDKGSNICKIIFGWDVQDELIPGLEYVSWEQGYPDFTMMPDLSTFAIVPWQANTASVICDFVETDGSPVVISPRQVLRNVLDRAERLGYGVRVGYELEFYMFRETPDTVRAKDFVNLDPATPGISTYSLFRLSSVAPVIDDMVQHMSDYGIKLEAANTEYGPGQFEINMHHDTAMSAADHVVMYKEGVRQIGALHGLSATFMAKYRDDWAGSSGHIHQSLWAADGSNAFSDKANPGTMSALAGQYAAGQLATMPAVTALLCPTINSYKRKVPGTWAPNTATLGVDNRTTSLRMVPGSPKACRIENRLAGADANPYLAIAAGIAGGLHGIEQGLTPPPPITGNAYELGPDQVVTLPHTLDEAVDLLQESKVVRELLGDVFVDHYVATRRWELDRFRQTVTDWERRRYFEII